jgi:hypothetical protein
MARNPSIEICVVHVRWHSSAPVLSSMFSCLCTLSNDRWMGVNMTHVLMSEHNACAGEGSCPCQTSHVSNQTRARHCECAKKKNSWTLLSVWFAARTVQGHLRSKRCCRPAADMVQVRIRWTSKQRLKATCTTSWLPFRLSSCRDRFLFCLTEWLQWCVRTQGGT